MSRAEPFKWSTLGELFRLVRMACELVPNPFLPSECWVCRRAVVKTGHYRENQYSHVRVGVGNGGGSGGRMLTHIFMWQHATGRTKPRDMSLDHLCDNSLCVNPAHLELVTQGDNMRRGVWRRKVYDAQREFAA